MEMNTDRKRILFADDDPEIREVVRILLEHEGFEVIEAGNGKEAVEKADETVDLIILDVMMPGKSGILACLDIRKKLTVPILFLTARTQDSDKALGFSAGGDDYLAKPFSYTELVARVKAMLRRCYVYQGGLSGGEKPAVLRIRDLSVDRDSREVRLEGEEVLLTDLEYRILLLMAENRGKIFTIQNIYESVWEEPYYYTSNNTVMVHIRNLRKKLEKDPKNPKYLVNVWGKGYRIE